MSHQNGLAGVPPGKQGIAQDNVPPGNEGRGFLLPPPTQHNTTESTTAKRGLKLTKSNTQKIVNAMVGGSDTQPQLRDLFSAVAPLESRTLHWWVSGTPLPLMKGTTQVWQCVSAGVWAGALLPCLDMGLFLLVWGEHHRKGKTLEFSLFLLVREEAVTNLSLAALDGEHKT